MLQNAAGPLTISAVRACLGHVIVSFNTVVDVEDGLYPERCLIRANDRQAGVWSQPCQKAAT